MAVPTFSPPVNPNRGFGTEVKPRVLSWGYGDGYTQRAADGLNTMPRSFSVTWGPIAPAQADAIEAFFEARGGVEPFLYTDPLRAARGLGARRFVCTGWQRTAPEINQEQIAATWVEDFGLSA